ncbi:unnamed protein product [Closterium sp. NIES-65]|nr:unnamed protein product [Closterium sp. NIES-65]
MALSHPLDLSNPFPPSLLSSSSTPLSPTPPSPTPLSPTPPSPTPLSTNPLSHPSLSHPSLSHPSLSHPSLSHPSLSHPSLSHPSLSHPSLSHPSLSQPSLSHPSLSHPSLSHPSLTNPTPLMLTFPPLLLRAIIPGAAPHATAPLLHCPAAPLPPLLHCPAAPLPRCYTARVTQASLPTPTATTSGCALKHSDALCRSHLLCCALLSLPHFFLLVSRPSPARASPARPSPAHQVLDKEVGYCQFASSSPLPLPLPFLLPFFPPLPLPSLPPLAPSLSLLRHLFIFQWLFHFSPCNPLSTLSHASSSSCTAAAVRGVFLPDMQQVGL